MDKKAKLLTRWLTIKMYLEEKFENNNFTDFFPPRGSIYTCHLGTNIGFEKGGMGRPVLVVSSDKINRASGNVIVVPLSRNIKWKDRSKKQLKYDTHYVLYKTKYPKLDYDSVVQCEDIRVVSKARLGDFICKIDWKTDMSKISKRLKSALAI